MSDSEDLRGLIALRAIQKNITDPLSRSKVISIIEPYIENLLTKSGAKWSTLSEDILTQELSWVSMERAELFKKIANQSNNAIYSNIEFASVVIKHTFLLANLSSDGEVLDGLNKLIQNFVAPANKLKPNEEEIQDALDKVLKELKPEQIEQVSNDLIAIQRLFVFDKVQMQKTGFSGGLSSSQLFFALEVLFIGMVDFYCQQDGPVKGLAQTFTILSFADKKKGSNFWGYTYEQAYDRLQLIIDWSKKHKEIIDTMKLGVQIFEEKFSSDFESVFKYPPISLIHYLKFSENEPIFNFFKTLNFKN